MWFAANLREQRTGKILSRLNIGLGRNRTHALSPTPSVAGTSTSWSQRSPMVPPNDSGGERHSSQPTQGGGGSVIYKNDDPHLDHKLPLSASWASGHSATWKGTCVRFHSSLANLRGTFFPNPALDAFVLESDRHDAIHTPVCPYRKRE